MGAYVGLAVDEATFLNETTLSPGSLPGAIYDAEVAFDNGNVTQLIDAGVSDTDIEVGTGGTASIVGGTDSSLFLWQLKNVVWTHNGADNTIQFSALLGSYAAAAGELVLNLKTGIGENPYGGSLTFSNVDNIVGGQDAGEYIVANNDGDHITSGVAPFATLIGGSGNDTLTSNAVRTLIVAGSGAATLTGADFGASAVFSYNGGVDTITNFAAGAGSADVLDLTSVSGVTNFAEAMADASQGDDETIFNFGNGHTVTLANVSESALTANNFIFSPEVAYFTASATGEADAGATVALTLAVSDALSITGGAPTLTLNDGAVATYDAAASDPSENALVFDYTVGAGDKAANLAIQSINANGATIEDSAGQTVSLPTPAEPFDLQIGASPLTVDSVTAQSQTGSVATGEVQISLQMSEAVTVTPGQEPFDLSLNDGATAAYDSQASDPSTGLLVFDTEAQSDDHAADLTVLSVEGATPFGADQTTVQDANGYNADFAAADGAALGVSAGSPLYVKAVTTNAAASPTGFGQEADAGSTVEISLQLSSALDVDTSAGSPTLTLSDGATATYDASASSLSAGTLVFDYTVGADDKSPDVAISSVNPNGATISDSAGDTPDFSGALGATNLQIGATPLTVESVSAVYDDDFSSTGGDTPAVVFTLTMSENVSFPQLPTEELSISDGDDAYFQGLNGDQITYADFLTTSANEFNPSITGVVTVDDLYPGYATSPLKDANGYDADLSGAVGFQSGVSVGDPLFVKTLGTNSTSGEVEGGQTVQIDLGMTEAFTVAGGTPTLSFTSGDTATYDAAATAASSDDQLVFDYTPAAGESALAVAIAGVNPNGATITDAAGNAAQFSALDDTPLQIEVGPAMVETDATSAVGDLTPGQTIEIDLSMSENVDVDTSGGSPTLTLSNGATATYDAAATADTAADSPTSVGQVIFDYTVGAGDATPNLTISSVNLNGSTFTDVASGAAAVLSGADNEFLGLDVVCFAAGTRIRTVRGDVAVEQLSVGDLVVTAQGVRRPIRWLGRRRIHCGKHPDPQAVMPIRIAAHAFAANQPSRDLFVSPGHAICVDVDGWALVPAGALVNGATIQQIEVDTVTYWHVELDSHDVILAENLAAESYLEMGNRAFFVAGEWVALRASPEGARRTHADFCYPFHADGAVVERARAALLLQAQRLGFHTTREGDAHLFVDGRRVEPIKLNDDRFAFVLPADMQNIELRSRTFVPAQSPLHSDDRRTLGLCIGRLQIDGRPIALGDLCLNEGWSPVESSPDACCERRWTKGAAVLPAQARIIIIELVGQGQYWRAPSQADRLRRRRAK